jgi:hypothetical protein
MKSSHTISVTSVKVVYAGSETSKYQSSAWVKNSTVYKKLLINGVDTATGELIYFFSPAAAILTANGFLNYEKLKSTNGWFTEIPGEITGHKGAAMFDGGDTPNIAIADSTKIVPTIEVGDIIEITGVLTYTSPKNGAKKLGRVKLTNI